MNQSTACCHDPASLKNAATPFSQILALDFYDGPTSGILQCANCSATYYFDMLDWDEDHQIRIFRLAMLPQGSLEQCVAVFARFEAPDWPVWVPWFRSSPSDEARDAVDRELEFILKKARPAELVVASSGYGEKVLAAVKVPAAELIETPDWFSAEGNDTRDWFALLGLKKGSKYNSAKPVDHV